MLDNSEWIFGAYKLNVLTWLELLLLCRIFFTCAHIQIFFFFHSSSLFHYQFPTVPKHCGNNNKDEDNSPKTLNDKNQQASSQKFRQLMLLLSCFFYSSFYVHVIITKAFNFFYSTKDSSIRADQNVEAEPLWEYPGCALSDPLELISFDVSSILSDTNIRYQNFLIFKRYFYFCFALSSVLMIFDLKKNICLHFFFNDPYF